MKETWFKIIEFIEYGNIPKSIEAISKYMEYSEPRTRRIIPRLVNHKLITELDLKDEFYQDFYTDNGKKKYYIPFIKDPRDFQIKTLKIKDKLREQELNTFYELQKKEIKN